MSLPCPGPWLDGSEAYEHLGNAGMAWEWLRRNNTFQADVARLGPYAGDLASGSAMVAPLHIQRRWGCITLPMIDGRAADAAPMWSRAADPYVLVTSARPTSATNPAAFFPDRWPDRVALATGHDGVEHLAISDGHRCVRLDVVEGTLQAGPVLFEYQLSGVSGLDRRIMTLRRLLALCRNDDFAESLHPPPAGSQRLAKALRVHDALELGASIRDIGTLIFGERRVNEEWAAPGEALKSQCRRLIATSKAMVAGGYLGLLAR